MQAGFDVPVAPVDAEHLLGIELGSRQGTEQILGFDLFGWRALAIAAAGQSGRLFDEGEADRRWASVKSDEAARLGTTAVEFTGLGDARLV